MTHWMRLLGNIWVYITFSESQAMYRKFKKEGQMEEFFKITRFVP